MDGNSLITQVALFGLRMIGALLVGTGIIVAARWCWRRIGARTRAGNEIDGILRATGYDRPVSTFRVADQVLPILAARGRLPDPCPVRVRLTDEHVFLYVGQRDWQWNRRTGEMIGAGTGCLPADETAPARIEGSAPPSPASAPSSGAVQSAATSGLAAAS
jgi:hypothetical protein